MNTNTTLTRSFIFYVATLLFFGVGGITSIGLEWYGGLQMPSWTPPEIVVAVIWGILFFATALSASVFWDESKHHEPAFVFTLALYMVNALLVLAWDYLFFGLHLLPSAFGMAILVGLSVVWLMARLWKESRSATLLLAPYLAWMLVALVLTYSVMILNT